MVEMKKILYIDDNPTDRILMDRLLSKHGFQVTLVDNPDDGFELAQEKGADLIILDIFIPGISGVELCKKLKNDSMTCSIPVILFSSIDTPKHLIDYKSYGATDFIQKTTSPEALIKQIKDILDME